MEMLSEKLFLPQQPQTSSCGCICFEVLTILLGDEIAQNFSSPTCGSEISTMKINSFIDNLTFVYVFVCHRQQQRLIAAFFSYCLINNSNAVCCKCFIHELEKLFPFSTSELMFFIWKAANRKTWNWIRSISFKLTFFIPGVSNGNFMVNPDENSQFFKLLANTEKTSSEWTELEKLLPVINIQHCFSIGAILRYYNIQTWTHWANIRKVCVKLIINTNNFPCH